MTKIISLQMVRVNTKNACNCSDPTSNIVTFIKLIIFILEFLGRTEIRISDLLREKSQKDVQAGPITKKLQLYEAESGVVTVRLDLQLF